MRVLARFPLPYSPAHAQATMRYTELSPERFKNFSAGARFYDLMRCAGPRIGE